MLVQMLSARQFTRASRDNSLHGLSVLVPSDPADIGGDREVGDLMLDPLEDVIIGLEEIKYRGCRIVVPGEVIFSNALVVQNKLESWGGTGIRPHGCWWSSSWTKHVNIFSEDWKIATASDGHLGGVIVGID